MKKHNTRYYTIGILVILLLAALAWWAADQPRPGRPPHPERPPGGGPVARKTFSGTVLAYGSNGRGDVDRLQLQTGTEEPVWLAFPPHTAAAVVEVAPLHAVVTVTAEAGPGHGYALVSLTGNGRQLEVAALPPPAPMAGEAMELTARGPVKTVAYGNGDATGFSVPGYLVELPPPAAGSLLPMLLRPGAAIVIKGYRRRPDGFVNRDGLQVIRPYDIAIDSIHYLLD